MGDIIGLEAGRRRLAANKGFRKWREAFRDHFDENTRPEDLSDRTLAHLIEVEPGPNSIVNELVMGVLGFGAAADFGGLEAGDKMKIVDMALFVLDQMRFECMRRLGWVETYPGLGVPLLDLVDQFDSRFSTARHETPALSPNHEGFEQYQSTYEADRGSQVRRLIPEAIARFREKRRGS